MTMFYEDTQIPDLPMPRDHTRRSSAGIGEPQRIPPSEPSFTGELAEQGASAAGNIFGAETLGEGVGRAIGTVGRGYGELAGAAGAGLSALGRNISGAAEDIASGIRTAGTGQGGFNLVSSAEASEAGADQASAAPAQALQEGLLSDEVRQAPAPTVSTPMSERGGIAPMSPDEIQRIMDYDATRRQFLEAAGTPSEVAPVRSAPGMPLPESLGELTVNERITGLPGGAEAYRQETRDGGVIYTNAPGPQPVTGERPTRTTANFLTPGPTGGGVAALMVPGVEQGQRAVHQARMEALRRGDRNAVQMSLRSPQQRMRDYEGRMARRQAARQRVLAQPISGESDLRLQFLGMPNRGGRGGQAYQQALQAENQRLQGQRELDIVGAEQRSRAALEDAQRQQALTEAAMTGGISERDIFLEDAKNQRARMMAASRGDQRPRITMFETPQGSIPLLVNDDGSVQDVLGLMPYLQQFLMPNANR